jgi:hypothetical protein
MAGPKKSVDPDMVERRSSGIPPSEKRAGTPDGALSPKRMTIKCKAFRSIHEAAEPEVKPHTCRQHLDISARAAGFRPLDRPGELAAASDSGGKPALAAQRFGKPVVTPLGKVVVVRVPILAENPLNQIAVVVEHKDDWLQPEAMELADFLRRQLVRSFAGDEDRSAIRSRRQYRNPAIGRKNLEWVLHGHPDAVPLFQ